MRRWRLAFVVCLLCSLWGEPARGQAERAPVRLRPGDAVRLLVQDDTLLSGEYDVLSDGTVLLPIIGLVAAAGMPFGEVSARIRNAFAKELGGQAVVVVPLLRVAVTGEVRTPGVLVIDPTYTWAEVVARAGGPLPTAVRDRVVLVRGGSEREVRRGELAALSVESGDELIVMRRGWFAENAPVLIASGTSLLVTIIALLVR
jgi:protein involved in polysaccharide export with SLBB domain